MSNRFDSADLARRQFLRSAIIARGPPGWA